MSPLTDPERTVLNNLQGGFPVAKRPFLALQPRLGLNENTQLRILKQMDEKGYLSRFGAVINPRAMGGDSRLAAMAVSHDRLETVSTYLNDQPPITHNYQRDHELNLWFVLSATRKETIDRTLEKIEQKTGIRVYNFPKIKEYYVGLLFRFEADGGLHTLNRPPRENPPSRARQHSVDSSGFPETKVIRAIQDGLPLVQQPYRRIARRLDVSVPALLSRLGRMLHENKIKRLGVVPNHYRLGVHGNAMTVFDVPNSRVDEIGRRLGERPEVTHCYRRPRYRPTWPYNLFAMVHEKTRPEAKSTVHELRRELGLRGFDHRILFSSRKLKKTGLRLS